MNFIHIQSSKAIIGKDKYYIMKSILMIVIAAYLSKCTLPNSGNQSISSNKNHLSDTSVVLLSQEKWDSTSINKYCIVVGSDTLHSYCIVSKSINNDNFKIRYTRSPNRDIDTADTSVVGELMEADRYKINIYPYKEYLREIELILLFISEKHEALNLTSIELNIFYMNSMMPYFEQQAKRKYGIPIKNISRKQLIKLVQESPFVDDLKEMLGHFSFVVDKIYIEEWLFFKINSDDYNIKDGNIQKYNTIGIDGSIIFSIGNSVNNK